jgi:hypothetical protein
VKRLKYPFIAGCGALLIAGAMLGPAIFSRMSYDVQIPYGLLLGALSCVVLYAVMRAIAAPMGNPQRYFR